MGSNANAVRIHLHFGLWCHAWIFLYSSHEAVRRDLYSGKHSELSWNPQNVCLDSARGCMRFLKCVFPFFFLVSELNYISSFQTAFFRQHGCTTTDASAKYNSRAAQVYREKIRQLASAAIAKYGNDVSTNEPWLFGRDGGP